MKYKILNGFSEIVIAFAFVTMLYFGYLMFWPFNPIDFLEGNFTTCKTSYKRGEIICYRLHYDKHLDVRGEQIVYFVDGIMFQMPDVMTNNPVGQQDFIKMAFVIPKELPVGHYKLRMTVTYKINPLREIERVIESNYFDVK